MKTCVVNPNIENLPKHIAAHDYIVGAEWDERTGQGAVTLQACHRLDGCREGPSNNVSSTNCDEDSNTAKLYHCL
jgi:hypothetical protein